MREILNWIAKILAIIFTLFIFSFVIEAVGDGFEWYMPLVAALPGVVLLIATVLAWRAPVFGGVVFIGLGASYLYQYFKSFPGDDWPALMVMAGIPIVVGALFLMGRK